MNTTTRKEENPNSSESVEASLEDFISQANATFPASDGWDLHTGDVELVDDEEGLEQADAPIVVKPAQRKAEAAAHLIKRADQSARSRKVSAAMLDDQNAATTVAPAPTRSSRRNPFEVAMPIEDDLEPAPLDPPPTGPRRRSERTEVVSARKSRAGVPWTANPLVWVAGVFAAFVAGAVLVFVMVRTMMPATPVVVQAPATAAAPQPSQPVVTPLDKTAQPAQHAAAQPVVTPLEGTRTPTPDEIPPPPVEKHASKHVASSHHASAAKPAPIKEAKASAPVAVAPKAESHKAPAKAAAASDDDDDDAPAAAPAPKKASKKAAAAKSDKPAKGGDWVDPFAQ
jgi:hypothetical protein